MGGRRFATKCDHWEHFPPRRAESAVAESGELLMASKKAIGNYLLLSLLFHALT